MQLGGKPLHFQRRPRSAPRAIPSASPEVGGPPSLPPCPARVRRARLHCVYSADVCLLQTAHPRDGRRRVILLLCFLSWKIQARRPLSPRLLLPVVAAVRTTSSSRPRPLRRYLGTRWPRAHASRRHGAGEITCVSRPEGVGPRELRVGPAGGAEGRILLRECLGESPSGRPRCSLFVGRGFSPDSHPHGRVGIGGPVPCCAPVRPAVFLVTRVFDLMGTFLGVERRSPLCLGCCFIPESVARSVSASASGRFARTALEVVDLHFQVH